MANSLQMYFDALERLRKGRPEIVPVGIKITQDAVSLEAGKGKGSIKKGRDIFKNLIVAIEDAAAEQERSGKLSRIKEKKLAEKNRLLNSDINQARATELSLIRQMWEAQKLIRELTGGDVLPFKKSGLNSSD